MQKHIAMTRYEIYRVLRWNRRRDAQLGTVSAKKRHFWKKTAFSSVFAFLGVFCFFEQNGSEGGGWFTKRGCN